MPITMPMAAKNITCSKCTPSTVLEVAPMLLKVAMILRRRSTYVATALAMPTPPTSSAVRPTKVRNCRNRSSVRDTWGDGSRLSRTVKPPSGNPALTASRNLSKPLSARPAPSGSFKA